MGGLSCGGGTSDVKGGLWCDGETSYVKRAVNVKFTKAVVYIVPGLGFSLISNSYILDWGSPRFCMILKGGTTKKGWEMLLCFFQL